MEEWKLVYDFNDEFPNLLPAGLFILLMAVGVGFYRYNKGLVYEGPDSILGINKREMGMLVGFLFICFATLMFIIVIPLRTIQYFNTKNVYSNKKYLVVEGKVNNFHPMPESGHDTERFNVNKIGFEYSDFDDRDYGYNNSASHGGVVREGLTVRISYFNNGDKNVILKLEKRD